MRVNSTIVSRYIKRLTILFLALIILYMLSVIFLFATFRVTSESMNPELQKNDFLIVYKPTLGARLFNVFAAIKGEDFHVYRMPGLRDFKRNDIVVFNYPYKEWDTWDHITLNLKEYYVKRCIGLPGDSILAKNGIFEVLGVNCTLGNYSMQDRASGSSFDSIPRPSYIDDCDLGWNLHDWGPIYVPKKDDSILIDKNNYHLYKKIIEWESDLPIDSLSEGIQYRFKHNYYFVAGDNTLHSIDSRYWGLVPDDFIVGKVSFAIGNSKKSFLHVISDFRRVK